MISICISANVKITSLLQLNTEGIVYAALFYLMKHRYDPGVITNIDDMEMIWKKKCKLVLGIISLFTRQLLTKQTRSSISLLQIHRRWQAAFNNKSLLSQRSTKSLSRTFSFTVLGWWNELLTAIRNAKSLTIFKRHLKTYLFCHHLNDRKSEEKKKKKNNLALFPLTSPCLARMPIILYYKQFLCPFASV